MVAKATIEDAADAAGTIGWLARRSRMLIAASVAAIPRAVAHVSPANTAATVPRPASAHQRAYEQSQTPTATVVGTNQMSTDSDSVGRQPSASTAPPATKPMTATSRSSLRGATLAAFDMASEVSDTAGNCS